MPNSVVIGKRDFSIEVLFQLYKQQPGKILFNTEYQRSFIWKPPKQRLLIDSILRDYDINKIFLRQCENGAFECLDGQQRLRSIFDFIEGKFSLGDDSVDLGLAWKSIHDLKQSHQQFYYKLLYSKIDAVVVYQADDETISDIFLRLQEGMPLNSPEKLNAMRGMLRNQVFQLSQHPFWGALGVDPYRFAYRYLCAQIARLELANDSLPAVGLNITEVKFQNLRKDYELYKNASPPKQVLDSINHTLNFLLHALGQTAGMIKQKGDVIPIYLVAAYILKRYASANQTAAQFGNFVKYFLTRVYSYQPYDYPYDEYRQARSYSTESRKSIQTAFDIILAKFLEHTPHLELKAPQRIFDSGQKLAIYYRDSGRCQGQGCGRNLKFDEAEFHHLKPWQKGGPTTVANGLLLCHDCHAKQPQ